MANKKQIPIESEWAKVIKAQDETSKKVLQEEFEIQKQSKIRYKEELDKQLRFKNKLAQSQNTDKEEELSFHKNQQLALKNYENRKKQDDRNYMQIFMNNNIQDLERKQKSQQTEIEKQKSLENERIKKLQQELDYERKMEESNKYMRIKEEQEELQRQQMEKMKKKNAQSLEKITDKKMIQKKIEEMKEVESSYKEFYQKRMQNLDQKMKNFQPIVESNMYKQELIEKRNAEWENITKEKQALRDKIEENNRVKAVIDLKSQLSKQIEDKQKLKIVEINEEKKHKEFAILKAREEEIEKNLEGERRKREREELKKVYEKQVREREVNDLMGMKMDSREKMMHSELLKNLNQHKLIAFPGVPGVHVLDSPIKQSFNRIYPPQANGPIVSGNAFLNEFYKQNSKTPPPFVDHSRSYEVYSGKNYNFPDPNIHNPITNPIGSNLPRALPGQRLTRGLQSHSKLALAGNSALI